MIIYIAIYFFFQCKNYFHLKQWFQSKQVTFNWSTTLSITKMLINQLKFNCLLYFKQCFNYLIINSNSESSKFKP
jgi:hypothetical protein